jgi:hypothetical protein
MFTIDDNDYVFAVQPRRYDPPQFVAETEDELDGKIGEFIGCGQCDSCGNSTYRIEPGKKRGFVAVCTIDPDDDPEFRWPEACGTRYPIHLERAGDTAF